MPQENSQVTAQVTPHQKSQLQPRQQPTEPFPQPWQRLHAKALTCAANFKRSEAELLEVIIEIDQNKIWQKLQLTSTFNYCLQYLKLTEDQAYAFIRVARRSETVPELKLAVMNSSLSLSKAKKIAAVVTPQNQALWIAKAQSLPTRELEKAVAEISPTAHIPDRLKAVAANQNELRCEINNETEIQLRRAQHLLSQKKRRAVSMGETLLDLSTFFLDRTDPLRIASRLKNKNTQRPHHASNGSAFSSSNGARPVNAPAKKNAGPLAKQAANPPAMHPAMPPANQPESLPAAGSSNPQRDSTGPRPVRLIPKPKRPANPAHIRHAVTLRDQARCQYRVPGQGICGSERWIQLHHRVPVSQGGKNTVANLVTLCSSHHALWHRH